MKYKLQRNLTALTQVIQTSCEIYAYQKRRWPSESHVILSHIASHGSRVLQITCIPVLPVYGITTHSVSCHPLPDQSHYHFPAVIIT